MDIIEIPVEKRLEICRAIAQFGEPRLPTKKELENPSYVLPSRKIGLKDVEDFIGIINKGKNIDDKYTAELEKGERTELDKYPGLYEEMSESVVQHYICGKLDPCVAHQVAGYVEIFYKARSLFYLTDIVVPNLLTMGLFKLALSEGCSKTKIHSHIGHEETKAQHAASYILDLTIMHPELRKLSPRMRCAGALWFIRFILKRHCTCRFPKLYCEHKRDNYWPKILQQVTGYREGALIRRIAWIYGSVLKSVNDKYYKKPSTEDDQSRWKLLFAKYSEPEHDNIANESKIGGFNEKDLEYLKSVTITL